MAHEMVSGSYSVVCITPVLPGSPNRTSRSRPPNHYPENPEWEEWQAGSQQFPNIWVAAATFYLVPAPRTDSKGEVVVDITEARGGLMKSACRLTIMCDCRFKGNQIIGAGIKYSLEDVVSKGVVADNLCGTSHVLADSRRAGAVCTAEDAEGIVGAVSLWALVNSVIFGIAMDTSSFRTMLYGIIFLVAGVAGFAYRSSCHSG